MTTFSGSFSEAFRSTAASSSDFPASPRRICSRSPSQGSAEDTEQGVAASGAGETAVCSGDSGGPLRESGS
ncbi:hypothetical protein [Aminiphilus circumscriptus]|uniref:hypothetical protein n=1 Tax=Aminiphilus circumscriptus TaxID=290732 RepID=UPI003B8490C4